jgi:hypothetical protein
MLEIMIKSLYIIMQWQLFGPFRQSSDNSRGTVLIACTPPKNDGKISILFIVFWLFK